tara:strand:- start:9092 stop:9322 length:231 start_codon:yes stop_codon:yes gene_type:complete
MSNPFSIKYNWKDFDNTLNLTPYQKHRIKSLYEDRVHAAIQKTINQSVRDRTERRKELESHRNPEEPFRLDIGGEG